MLDATQPIARLVLDHSECAAVLQRHRIDYCCNGQLSLEEATKARGVDLSLVLGELEVAMKQRLPEDGQPDLRALDTAQLVERARTHFHDPLHRTLPFVRALAAKVKRVHGDRSPSLVDLDARLSELTAALLSHLEAESTQLFPALLAGARVDALLTEAKNDHEGVRVLLERVREAANDFEPPDWACNSYRTLFSELKWLEHDVFALMHLENHVLLQRFGHEQ